MARTPIGVVHGHKTSPETTDTRNHLKKLPDVIFMPNEEKIVVEELVRFKLLFDEP